MNLPNSRIHRVQLEVRGINLSSELKNHPEGMPAISRWLRPKADTTGVRAGGYAGPGRGCTRNRSYPSCDPSGIDLWIPPDPGVSLRETPG